MQAEVYFAGQPVGTILWLPDAYGVQAELDCACPADAPALLRCYGETGGAPLLIGLPERRAKLWPDQGFHHPDRADPHAGQTAPAGKDGFA